jgi:hypothetical protein
LQPFKADGVDGEQWNGFWCLTDGKYYARCVERDGREVWFCIADDSGARVLPFRRRGADAPRSRSVMVFGRVGRRSVLIGRYARRDGAAR